jgi:uncharacterized protein (TIGR04255 family)
VKAQVIIDIDVFRKVEISPESYDDIWQILPNFREVKNRVFYKCIGPATISECGGVDRS